MNLPSHEDVESVSRYLKFVVSEAAVANCSAVRFVATDDRILVERLQDGDWIEREHPPIRLWHSLLASIHSLLGDKLIRACSEIERCPAINTVELSTSLPWLSDVREVGCESLRLHFGFSQSAVTMRITRL